MRTQLGKNKEGKTKLHEGGFLLEKPGTKGGRGGPRIGAVAK